MTRSVWAVAALSVVVVHVCRGNTPATPYGVCSHISRGGYAIRDESCKWIAMTGIGRVRTDFLWRECQKEYGAPFDFSKYDAVVASAERTNVQVLPIVYGAPKWAQPAYRHLDEFGRWVESLTRWYGNRLPEIEVWNEPNLKSFWGETPNPTNYLMVLKAAYAAAKRGNPDVRVFFGGTAGVPLDFIEDVYRLGGARYFDAINVHPYSHPHAPEGSLDVKLEMLKALMAKYSDADKPIVITEHGWPTHESRVDAAVLSTGLAMARPQKKAWNVVYAVTSSDLDGNPSRTVGSAIENVLPSGSRLESCFGARLRERLAQGDVDAVLYPFDETFPIDTFEAVYEFVKAGGTLVDCGGMPMWFACREKSPGTFQRDATAGCDALRRRLRIHATAYWWDTNLPEKERAFPTAAAKSAGYRGDPAGDWVARFQTPKLLKSGDEWLPILTLKDKAGQEAVGASVMRFNSDMKGCVVVSGIMSKGAVATSDETAQARYLVRSLAISLAEGVESYYWYEMRSPEIDPTYSEDHFGIMHANLTPKPGWGAYRNFILQRPMGSVQKAGVWHDDVRRTFYPQWTRPDGVRAGVIWRIGPVERVACTFDSSGMRFVDYTGKTVKPLSTRNGSYALLVGESPLFFVGGHLTRLSQVAMDDLFAAQE